MSAQLRSRPRLRLAEVGSYDNAHAGQQIANGLENQGLAGPEFVAATEFLPELGAEGPHIQENDSRVGVVEKGPERGRKVEIRTPQRGVLRDLVGLASANADLALAQRIEARDSVEVALEELREKCGLSRLPRRIECYDVSTLNGTLAVASRVVFEDGKPDKSSYRRYRIRQALAGDDYGCLREVLCRRLRRVETEPLPDLLMVDGGRGQLGVVGASLADAELEVDTLGIAKQRDDESPSVRVKRGGGLKAERVFLPGRTNPVMLPPSSKALLLLQRVRDESHRFAIEFQR